MNANHNRRTPVNVTVIDQKLERAIRHLEAAKIEESAATIRRLDAESALLAIIGDLPAEGTFRHSAGGLTAIVQTSVRRTVDQSKLLEVAPYIPEAIRNRLIRWKPDLDTHELRYIESNEPRLYEIVAEAVTTKPAKPSIRIEPTKQKEAA